MFGERPQNKCWGKHVDMMEGQWEFKMIIGKLYRNFGMLKRLFFKPLL